MIKGLIKYKDFFFSGHERSIKAKKNILSLFFIKGYSVFISFALIPLTLELLNDYKYGVWITVFNFLSMLQIFDIGIGNGLRNKLAEALALNEIRNAREYVSTSYVVMAVLALLLIIFFLIPWYYIEWFRVFNTGIDIEAELKILIGVCYIITVLQFFLNLMNSILTAYHKPAFPSFIFAISNTIILFIFILFKSLINESLVLIGLIYTIVPLILFLIFSFWVFNTKYKEIRPSILFYNKAKVKDLFSLGGSFFIIQFAGLVIFQTDALIISHTLSPEEVTPYSIVYKYFSITIMLTTIILTPLWSAYTEAYAKNDFKWIKNIINKQLKGLLLIMVIIALMLLFSKPIIKLWVNKEMELSWILLIGTAIFSVVSVWNNIFAMFLNGLSKTKTQIKTSIVGLIINIPLSILLAKSYGAGGVIIGTIISLLFFAVFGAIETFSILKKQTL
ncbi:MATE family efflux transporter [Mariniflexile sp.]|uniref:MATE family efflux transporter n=1 Tax=Mariniflexile sp. TaxID=1979402 RepID=UPI0035619547